MEPVNQGDLSILIDLVNMSKKNHALEVTSQTRLIEDAGIDSLALMEIIEAAQQKCNVVFAPEDYSAENFSSINSIGALVGECRTRSHAK